MRISVLIGLGLVVLSIALTSCEKDPAINTNSVPKKNHYYVIDFQYKQTLRCIINNDTMIQPHESYITKVQYWDDGEPTHIVIDSRRNSSIFADAKFKARVTHTGDYGIDFYAEGFLLDTVLHAKQ